MRQRSLIILIFLILYTFLTGCNFMPSPDNTIASPRPEKNISASNDDVNSIIPGFLPYSSKLLVPKASKDRLPIHSLDLDGDGVNEIILTFMDEKQVINSGFMILKKGEHVWEKQFEEPDDYKTINLVDFSDITGDNLPEIFIGKDNILNIYHYSNKEYQLIKSIPYTEYTSSDFPGKYGEDSMIELLVYNKVIDEPAVNLLRWNGYKLQDVSEEYSGQKLELIHYYKQIVNESPGKSSLWFNLSKLQMEANLSTDALASIEKAIFLESHPDTLIEYNIFKAQVFMSMGKHNEAIKSLSSDAIQRAPYISDCKSVIAESYFMQKNYIKAREIYEEIAVFPYDENIQRIDTAIVNEKIYQYINALGEGQLSELPEKLNKFGYDNSLVINSIIPRSSVKDLNSVLIVDYHLSPVLAHGKDSVGAHLIYWWDGGKLYVKEYTTIGLYSNHHLSAYFLSKAASIKVDHDGTIKMRITFQNTKKNDTTYPAAINQTFLFRNNEWKFFWK